jgi:hypothetical protein
VASEDATLLALPQDCPAAAAVSWKVMKLT